MVISHKYKYVFIETPQTGSSAVAKELCINYDGKPILKKHARYKEFVKWAKEKEKQYFIFTSIRNPMDIEVSTFHKLREDHRNRVSKRLKIKGLRAFFDYRLLRASNIIKKYNSFRKYFLEKTKLGIPYDNELTEYYSKMDYVIRFENINKDFKEVLSLLNIDVKRDLPIFNKTSSKNRDFTSFYTTDLKNRSINYFIFFLYKYGYSFPKNWNNPKLRLKHKIIYQFFHFSRRIYWNNIKIYYKNM